MKRLSIKLKITLWFTAFMILLSLIVFAFIAVVSNTTTTHQRRAALTALVDDNMGEVEYEDGEIEIDDDFVSFRNGVYCLVFDTAGAKIRGYSPYAQLEAQPFADGAIRSLHVDGEAYLYYDRLISSGKYPDLWVRGVVLDSGNAVVSSGVYQAALIALPLLILLAAVGGYLLARRSLRPMREIGQTAEEIGGSGDLSKRIELAGNGSDELYRLAEAFNRMFQRLEQNFEAQRNFTSDASHELRTPMATILAQCEYAFENARGEQELYEAIGAIQKQGYRMSRLIESLLEFTRMEQRTETMALEPVDLSALVLSVCAEQRRTAEKGIVLGDHVQPGVRLNGDLLLLSRMLENLIRNAYRYGREKGTIAVSLKEQAGVVTLQVADNGVGIEAEDLPKIWNRFYRVDQSRSSAKEAGFGLGLAMVRQIAELHGGTAQAESEPGRGSVFTVIFPR